MEFDDHPLTFPNQADTSLESTSANPKILAFLAALAFSEMATRWKKGLA